MGVKLVLPISTLLLKQILLPSLSSCRGSSRKCTRCCQKHLVRWVRLTLIPLIRGLWREKMISTSTVVLKSLLPRKQLLKKFACRYLLLKWQRKISLFVPISCGYWLSCAISRVWRWWCPKGLMCKRVATSPLRRLSRGWTVLSLLGKPLGQLGIQLLRPPNRVVMFVNVRKVSRLVVRAPVRSVRKILKTHMLIRFVISLMLWPRRSHHQSCRSSLLRRMTSWPSQETVLGRAILLLITFL